MPPHRICLMKPNRTNEKNAVFRYNQRRFVMTRHREDMTR